MLMRICLLTGLCAAWIFCWKLADVWSLPLRTEHAVTSQFDTNPAISNDVIQTATMDVYAFGWLVLILIGIAMFSGDLKRLMTSSTIRNRTALMLLVFIFVSGCYRPFQPVILETIGSNEEGFLIPLKGEDDGQRSTHSEDLLTRSLVQTKQVRIPQQWVPHGYEYTGPNGKWQPAAVLIKVDRSPVTCEWTADVNTGTGSRNEAIWVMTSDQVEFSTGWTCTGRIASREDCVKFLYNYPNGSIKSVMDREVRALVQTTFGLEVTDQPMSKLRSEATPHIQSVVSKVTSFFETRGLTITNLGISGGFIYTDKKISDRMTELFVAEQGEAIATAKANSQQKEAKGLADAVQLKAKGEADAIKLVADAKAYEIQKANEDLKSYLELKRLELEMKKLEKWDGKFPTYYIGSQSPEMLLTLPQAVSKIDRD